MSKPQQEQTWPLRPPLNVYPQQMYNMYQGHGMCQELCYPQPSMPTRPTYMPRPYPPLPYQSDSYSRQAPQPMPQYVPVSPYTSSRNYPSQLQRHSVVHRPIPQNRYDYDYYPVNKSRTALKKPSNTHEYLHGNNHYPNNQYPPCNVYPPQETESALRNIDVRQFLSTWQEKDEDITESADTHLKPTAIPLSFTGDRFEPLDYTKRTDNVPQNYDFNKVHTIPYYNRNDAQVNPPSSSSMAYLQPYVNNNPLITSMPNNVDIQHLGDTNPPSMSEKDSSFIPYERSIEKIYNPRLYQESHIMPKNAPSNQCALSENMFLNQLRRDEFKPNSQYHLSASLENDDMFDDINRKKEEKQKNVVHPLCHAENDSSNEKLNFSPNKTKPNLPTQPFAESILPFNPLENFNEPELDNTKLKESQFSGSNLKRKYTVDNDDMEPAQKYRLESNKLSDCPLISRENCETPGNESFQSKSDFDSVEDVLSPAHSSNEENAQNAQNSLDHTTHTQKNFEASLTDSKNISGLNHEFEISSEDIELSISSGDSLGIENTSNELEKSSTLEPIDSHPENRSVLQVAEESYETLDKDDMKKSTVLKNFEGNSDAQDLVDKDPQEVISELSLEDSCMDGLIPPSVHHVKEKRSNALQSIAFCYQDLNLSEDSSDSLSRSFLTQVKYDLKISKMKRFKRDKRKSVKKMRKKKRNHFKPNSLLNWKIKHNLMPKVKEVDFFKKCSRKRKSKIFKKVSSESKEKPQDTLNILTECSKKNCEVNCVIYQSDEPHGDLNSILADEVQISGKCQDSINNNTTLGSLMELGVDKKSRKIVEDKKLPVFENNNSLPVKKITNEESKFTETQVKDGSDDKKLRNVIANFFTAGKLKIDSDLTCSFDERELVNQIIIKGGEEVGSAKWHFKNVKTVSQKESIKCSLTWEKIFKSLYEQNDVFKKDSLELGPAKIFLTLSPKAGQVQEKFLKDTNLNVFKATINARKLILKRNDACEGRIPKMVIRKSEGLGYRSFIKDSILQNETKTSSNEPQLQSQVFSFRESQSSVDSQAEKKEVHHCILCQKSFTSLQDFQDHESSKNHRHLDIVQRNALHKIYNAAYGSDHPNCRPLSDLDKEFLNWKPHFPGFKHNYHYALP